MILKPKDRFLTLEALDAYWDHPFGWVGAPQGGSGGEIDQEFIKNRLKLEIIGGVVDSTLSYEYDEFAVVRYKRKLYLLETRGCSCPSPTETWRVVLGPVVKAEMLKEIKAGNYRGYTLPDRLEAELIEVIQSC